MDRTIINLVKLFRNSLLINNKILIDNNWDFIQALLQMNYKICNMSISTKMYFKRILTNLRTPMTLNKVH